MKSKPYIVGIGGTGRENSSTERALRASLDHAKRLGCRTALFAAADLDLPMYGSGLLTDKAQLLVEAVRQCDGLLLATPGYHGSISGMVKNALDYVEELRADERPYLEGRAVGSIVCAYGPQAIGTTIVAVRSIVHALRGWPTPVAAGINSADLGFDAGGRCTNAAVQQQLELVARQVCEFGSMYAQMEACAELTT
jgi:FMN reductase